MRLQSEKKVFIRGKTIGGPKLLVCMPMTAANPEALMTEARQLAAQAPDLVEWRADGFGATAESMDFSLVLQQLRKAIGNIPLLFTCRIDREGGACHLPQKQRQAIIINAIGSGHVDLVDVEMGNESDFLKAVFTSAASQKVPVMLSYHNFKKTPEVRQLVATFFQARELGADIAKIAVMPRNPQDVLNLLQAGLQARMDNLGIPAVAISMGNLGMLSRLSGGLFGSDITFAAGVAESAPGQLPLAVIGPMIQTFYAPLRPAT